MVAWIKSVYKILNVSRLLWPKLTDLQTNINFRVWNDVLKANSDVNGNGIIKEPEELLGISPLNNH